MISLLVTLGCIAAFIAVLTLVYRAQLVRERAGRGIAGLDVQAELQGRRVRITATNSSRGPRWVELDLQTHLRMKDGKLGRFDPIDHFGEGDARLNPGQVHTFSVEYPDAGPIECVLVGEWRYTAESRRFEVALRFEKDQLALHNSRTRKRLVPFWADTPRVVAAHNTLVERARDLR